MRKMKKVTIYIAILIVILVGAIIGYSKMGYGKSSAAISKITSKVIKGNIKVEISGAGVIEPVKRYDITPLVSGNIISSTFEEGQSVKKGDIIYRFDATELKGNIQKTKDGIQRLELNDKSTRENLNKTTIYAGASGRLTDFSVKVNDNVSNNKVGDIIYDSDCFARVPFNETQIKKIKLGQWATVTSPTYMSSVRGKVTSISHYPIAQIYGVRLYDIEIKIEEDSSLRKGDEVSARIGSMESPVIGKIDVPDAYSIIPEVTGTVNRVYVKNDDDVTKGQKLFELDKESYVSTLKMSALDHNDAIINLRSEQKQLEDYNIKAPIDGIILKKIIKQEIPSAPQQVGLILW